MKSIQPGTNLTLSAHLLEKLKIGETFNVITENK